MMNRPFMQALARALIVLAFVAASAQAKPSGTNAVAEKLTDGDNAGFGRIATVAPTEGELQVPGAVLHYTVFGEGKPLLLLAGGPGLRSEYLRPIVAGIGEGYRCVLLDQRGTGRSEADKADATTINLDAFVQDLETLRAHLQIDRWVVLGHSWGGMLAMAYATRRAERIEALVLADSGGPTLEFTKYFEDNQLARLSLEERELSNYWSEPKRQAADPQRAMYEQFRARAPSYVFDRKIALLMIAGMSPQAFSAQVHNLIMADLAARKYDLRSGLKNLALPVLIVAGRQDPIGESTAYEVRESLPQASLKFIEKCGHFPWIEQPQSFFQAVTTFLKALPR